jgi:hypothetical protein
MFDLLPVPISVYCFSLVLGIAAPLLIFLMLRPALKHFLASMFADPRIEAFWQQVILLVMLLAALSAAVRYRPDVALLVDAVALTFSLADSVQSILEMLLYAVFALFLPLLATYTVLHATRARTPRSE